MSSSSSFLKTSPYSSSYGLYGTGTVNPYASYFGPSPSTPSQNPPPPQTAPPPPTATSPFSSSFSSPPPSSTTPFSFGVNSGGGFNMNPPVATAPAPSSSFYASPLVAGNLNALSMSMSTSATTAGARPISGGSPPYFSPVPAQTRIIGGVNNSGSGGSGATSPPVRLSSGGPTSGGASAAASSSPLSSSMWGFANPSGTGGRSDNPSHEPMHFSPGSSPSSSSPYSLGGGHQHQQQHNPVYLPCYFLGLDQPHHYQGGGGSGGGGILGGSSPGISPGRIGGPGAFMTTTPSGRSNTKRTVLFEPKSFPETETSHNPEDSSRQAVKKLKGPPIHGFGSSEGTSTQDFLEAVIRTETATTNTHNQTNSSFSSPPSMFGSGGGSSSKNSPSIMAKKCWVTIFGFPAGASSFIVNNFSTLGKIMEVKCTPGSNWLHIRFSDPIEARRALSRNGKVLGQSIMVGVIPSEPKVIEEAEKANISNNSLAESSNKSSAPSPILRERNVFAGSSAGDSLKSRIRPLATGYNPTSSSKMVSPPRSVPGGAYSNSARDTFSVSRGNPEGVPVPAPASTGIVTKTLEFFFGW